MTEEMQVNATEAVREDVRDFLSSAAEARLEYRRRRERADELERRSRWVTGIAGGQIHRGGRGPEALWAALADERERELAAAGEELERYRQVEELIGRLDKPIHRVVLRMRYLRYLTWRQVREQMEREGYRYEERQIFRLHTEAVKEARRLWEERVKTPVT